MLEIGSVAPAFTLPDKEGKLVSLKDFAGKKVVFIFILRILPRAARVKHRPFVRPSQNSLLPAL